MKDIRHIVQRIALRDEIGLWRRNHLTFYPFTYKYSMTILARHTIHISILLLCQILTYHTYES